MVVNGATITDAYWVKPLDSALTYEEILFDKNSFATLALLGTYDSFNYASRKANERTPELTNIGSFEKSWRLRNNQWWMYKAANHNELFSEWFVCKLGKALGMNMAEYEPGPEYAKCIMSTDFTFQGQVNFEPAHSLLGDNLDYIFTATTLRELSPSLLPDYIRMIYLDTLVFNPDRHTSNFGLLRNWDGQILGMAPNFDNNLALIANGYPKNITRKEDRLISDLLDILQWDNSLVKYLPEVSEVVVKTILAEMNMRVRREEITQFIMNGYRRIKEGLQG